MRGGARGKELPRKTKTVPLQGHFSVQTCMGRVSNWNKVFGFDYVVYLCLKKKKLGGNWKMFCCMETRAKKWWCMFILPVPLYNKAAFIDGLK